MREAVAPGGQEDAAGVGAKVGPRDADGSSVGDGGADGWMDGGADGWRDAVVATVAVADGLTGGCVAT